jgi:hypothetical protein
MTLTINLPPDTERGLLAMAEAKGVAPADLVVELLDCEFKPEDLASGTEAGNLVELFENSPFRGLGMMFERDKDYGREINL